MSLVYRRIDMLTRDDIRLVAKQIGANEAESKQINVFLAKTHNVQTKNINFEYYPCILIVDEVRYIVMY